MRLSTYLLGVPAVVLAIIVAVANRQIVVFSLDPFSDVTPAFAVRMPLFLLLFLTFVAGVLLGWFVAVLTRRPSTGAAPKQKSLPVALPGSGPGAKTPPR